MQNLGSQSFSSSTFENKREQYQNIMSHQFNENQNTGDFEQDICERSVSGNSLNLQSKTTSHIQVEKFQKKREQFQVCYEKFLRGINHSINIIKAVTMRLIFSLHSFIAILYVYSVKEDEWYLVNVIGVVFLFIELFITIIKRKGKEPRW